MSSLTTTSWAAAFGVACGLAPCVASGETFTATLRGSEENPVNTSVAMGSFTLEVLTNVNGVLLASHPYRLSYRNLEGEVLMAHIHLGQPGVNGNVVIWLCQTVTNPAPASVAATTPTCPGPTMGNVTSTITASKVLGLAAQRLEAQNLNELLVRALRTGAAYVNVHTTVLPGGEIRGQLE
jgi:hypothetical protein